MSDSIIVNFSETREERYKRLIPQLKALIEPEAYLIANLANVSAALKQTFDFFWVGFYLVRDGELWLGPFQGPVACTRIQSGKGVCGTAWQQKQTIIVKDVNLFPGHISCNEASKSEIVIPCFDSDSEVRMVLDIDSNKINDFSELDQNYLEQIVQMIPLKESKH